MTARSPVPFGSIVLLLTYRGFHAEVRQALVSNTQTASDPDILARLLKAHGRDRIHKSILYGDEERCALLLRCARESAALTNSDLNFLLTLAVFRGVLGVVSILLSYGANVTATSVAQHRFTGAGCVDRRVIMQTLSVRPSINADDALALAVVCHCPVPSLTVGVVPMELSTHPRFGQRTCSTIQESTAATSDCWAFKPPGR